MLNQAAPGRANHKCLSEVTQGILHRPVSGGDVSSEAVAVVVVGSAGVGEPVRYNVWWIYKDRTLPATIRKDRCDEILVEEFRPGEKVILNF